MQLKKLGKVIVFGDNYLGKAIQNAINNVLLIPKNQIDFLDCDRMKFNLHLSLDGFIIEAVINCAQYSFFGKDEVAHKLTLKSSQILAQYCNSRNINLICFSSYSVFDGSKEEPYTEEDETNPLNSSGKHALMTEQAILSIRPQTFIFRLPWLYSVFFEDNLVFQLVQAMTIHEVIKISDDQRGNLLNTFDLGGFIATFLDNLKNSDLSNNADIFGIYHLSAHGFNSKFEIVKMILHTGKHYVGDIFRTTSVIPLALEKITGDAGQRNCCLSSFKLQENFNIRLPDWRFSLHNAAQKMLKRLSQRAAANSTSAKNEKTVDNHCYPSHISNDSNGG